jgi:hypothetical protein
MTVEWIGQLPELTQVPRGLWDVHPFYALVFAALILFAWRFDMVMKLWLDFGRRRDESRAAKAVPTPITEEQLQMLLQAIADIQHIKEQLAAMDVKTEAMWGLQMRVGLSEGLRQGLLTQNSPVKIADARIRELLESHRRDLNELYRQGIDELADKGLSMEARDAAIMLRIEKDFGGVIEETIARPNGIGHGSCLWAALIVAGNRDMEEAIA